MVMLFIEQDNLSELISEWLNICYNEEFPAQYLRQWRVSAQYIWDNGEFLLNICYNGEFLLNIC